MTVEGEVHAFSWSLDHGLVDLHSSTLGRSSAAKGVNNYEQVVGSFQGSEAAKPQRAFLGMCGQQFDLNELITEDSGWLLQQAVDINGAGEIVGVGLQNGKRRGFVLVPGL